MAAVEAGVDALGFIFHPKSPRVIEPGEARLIIEQLPPFVDTVGVFVDRDHEEVEEIIRFCSLSYVQLHGQEPPRYCEQLARLAAPCQIIKALRVGPHLRAEEIASYSPHIRAFLLDTYQQGQEGGTGRCFDWSLITGLRLQRNFILAGGLDAGNIRQALETVQPATVDVNSGIESSPGRKDHARLRELVAQVRMIEQED